MPAVVFATEAQVIKKLMVFKSAKEKFEEIRTLDKAFHVPRIMAGPDSSHFTTPGRLQYLAFLLENQRSVNYL